MDSSHTSLDQAAFEAMCRADDEWTWDLTIGPVGDYSNDCTYAAFRAFRAARTPREATRSPSAADIPRRENYCEPETWEGALDSCIESLAKGELEEGELELVRQRVHAAIAAPRDLATKPRQRSPESFDASRSDVSPQPARRRKLDAASPPFRLRALMSEALEMTHRKAADINARGYKLVGFVLRDAKGERAVIEDSKVRWMSADAFVEMLWNTERYAP